VHASPLILEGTGVPSSRQGFDVFLCWQTMIVAESTTFLLPLLRGTIRFIRKLQWFLWWEIPLPIEMPWTSEEVWEIILESLDLSSLHGPGPNFSWAPYGEKIEGRNGREGCTVSNTRPSTAPALRRQAVQMGLRTSNRYCPIVVDTASELPDLPVTHLS
jgi:hypothetical protein